MTPTELAQWRAESRLTQPALAALLGVHPITVAKWETAARGIPPYLHLALQALTTIQHSETCKPQPTKTIASRWNALPVADRVRIMREAPGQPSGVGDYPYWSLSASQRLIAEQALSR